MFKVSVAQAGNIMLALFAAIGAVGVIGATGMTVLKGPVRSMHMVTQKTIAENNIIASSKLAVMAAANQANGGDCDADGTVEPVAWSITGTGPKPTGGGYLPANIGASLQDPWNNTYGYCVWDHGSAIQTTCPTPTQRLQGASAGSGPVIAIISSGPDRTFQTSCANAPAYVQKVSGSDDIVLSYTYAEASAASGGLWNLQAGDPNTAEIGKNLEVKDSGGDTTFELDRETGIGDFIGIRTGSIAAKGVEPVQMAGGLKMDSETNVTQCSLPQHAGIMRFHSIEGLQICSGTEWMNAGGTSSMPTLYGAVQLQSGTTANSIYTPTVNLTKGAYLGFYYNCLQAASSNYFVNMEAVATAGTIVSGYTNRRFEQMTAFTQVPFVFWVTSDTATVRFRVWNPDGGTLTTAAAASNCANFEYYQVLSAGTDNGSGGGGGSGSLWSQLGSNVYYNSGNVGIGTSTPATKLQITGTDPRVTLQDTRPVSDMALTAGMMIRDNSNNSVGFIGDGSVASNMMQLWSYVEKIALGTSLAHPITFHTNYTSAGGLDASERMRIAADGKVGIGTLAPATKLHVAGSGAILTLQNNTYPKSNMAHGNIINFTDNAGANVGYLGDGSSSDNGMHVWSYDDLVRIGTSTAYPITFHTNYNAGGSADASEKMRITAAGNIGIGGMLNPTGHIHILGKDSASPIVIDRPFHGPAIVMRNIAGSSTVNSYPNVTDRWEIYPNGVSSGSTASRLSFVTRTPAEVPTTQMSINNSGTLTVTGAIGFAGGRGGMNYYNVSPYDQVELGVSSAFPSTSLSFFTNSISRMNIDPSGKVGIGTVTPQEQFHVVGKIMAAANSNWGAGSFSYSWPRAFLSHSGYLWSTTDSSNAADANLYLHRHNTSNYFAIFGYGTTSVGTISTNGASVSYNTTSDYRLKDKIAPIHHGLDSVMALKPKSFVYKADKSAQEIDGFIAHEVQEILPYAVNGKKDAVDKDGKPKYQQLDYSKLTPVLTAAIQELKALFDGLLEKIASLTGVTERLASENEHLKAEIRRLSGENDAMRAEFNERLKLLEAKEEIKPE